MVEILLKKSDVPAKIRSFFYAFEGEFCSCIRRFHSDNGTDFSNRTFAEFLDCHGSAHTFAAAYYPQSNRVLERAIGTVLERVRAFLLSAPLDNRFWAEAATPAVHTINVLAKDLLGD